MFPIRISKIVLLTTLSLLFPLHVSSNPTKSPKSSEHTYLGSSVTPTSQKLVDEEFCQTRYISHPDYKRGCLLYLNRPLQLIDVSKNIEEQINRSADGELLVFENSEKNTFVEISKTLEIKSGQGILPGSPSQFITISASPQLPTEKTFTAIEINNVNENIFIAGLNISRESFKKQAQFEGGQHLLTETSYISINNNHAEIELTWLNLAATPGLKKMIDIQGNQGTFRLNRSYLNGNGARWGVSLDGTRINEEDTEKEHYYLEDNIITSGDTKNYQKYDGYEHGADNGALMIYRAGNVNVTRTILSLHEYQSAVHYQSRHLVRLFDARKVSLDSLYFTAEGEEREKDFIAYIQGDSKQNTNLVLTFHNNLNGTGFKNRIRTELSEIVGTWHDNQIISSQESIPSPEEFFSCLYHEEAVRTTPSESEFSHSTHDNSILTTQTPARQSPEQHSLHEWLPFNSDKSLISFDNMIDQFDNQDKNNLPTRYKNCPIWEWDKVQKENPEDNSSDNKAVYIIVAVTAAIVLIEIMIFIKVLTLKKTGSSGGAPPMVLGRA